MSLVAKLRMYILGTVRMFLLHMIMIRRMALTVVPNIKRNENAGAWTYFEKLERYS
jgi:hypothetical protein